MILELKDDEILDFLMTSEFEEDYKPEELKYLLYKFRYFYRILNGKYDLLKTNTDVEIQLLEESLNYKEVKIKEALSEKANLENKFSNLNGRKLSLKERITGKIIEKNEN